MYYLTANHYYKVRIILYLYLFIHTYIYPLKFFWLNLQITNYDILSLTAINAPEKIEQRFKQQQSIKNQLLSSLWNISQQKILLLNLQLTGRGIDGIYVNK